MTEADVIKFYEALHEIINTPEGKTWQERRQLLCDLGGDQDQANLQELIAWFNGGMDE